MLSITYEKFRKPCGSQEKRKLLGPGRTKLISVRVPEDDLKALRDIAEENDRKYQQLIIQAIERFLEEYLHRFRKKYY